MNDEIQALKEWALSTFVQKDACSDRHEKTDEKINSLLIDNTKIIYQCNLLTLHRLARCRSKRVGWRESEYGTA